MSDTGYDRQEPKPLFIIAIAIFLILFVAGAGFGIRSYFLNNLEAEQRAKIGEAPTTDVDLMKKESQAILHSYGYVDQAAGTMHMPIERAMEMEVERAHAAAATPAPAPTKSAAKTTLKASDKSDTKTK